MSTTSKILIVGAGLGGLCAASALAQIGADVDVIEIKPENTVPGVGFGLRTNALRALREIGLYDQCLSIGFHSPTLTYYDRYGDHVVELPFGRQIDGMPNNVSCRDSAFSRSPPLALSSSAAPSGCRRRSPTWNRTPRECP